MEVFWLPSKDNNYCWWKKSGYPVIGSLSRYLPGFIHISQVVVWDFCHQQYLHEFSDGQLIIGFLRGVVIPLIFPKVSQSSLGILRIPQLPPPLEHFSLKNHANLGKKESIELVQTPAKVGAGKMLTFCRLGIYR